MSFSLASIQRLREVCSGVVKLIGTAVAHPLRQEDAELLPGKRLVGPVLL